MAHGKVQGVVGLEGFPYTSGGFNLSAERIVRFEMPSNFTAEGIQHAQKDFEMVAAMLRDNPEEMRALLDAVVQNRLSQAQEIAEKLGISEHKFQAQGGGLW